MTVALSPLTSLGSLADALPSPALSSYQRALLARISPPGHSEWILAHKHPTPRLGAGQVLIRTAYVALNPFDWQGVAFKFGLGCEAKVMGRDGAGEVVEVGKGVTRFKPGDRVWFCANSAQSGTGAFQEYSLHSAVQVGRTPDNISDEEAATLGTGLITAGIALSRALDLPLLEFAKLPKGERSSRGWLLIWGGAGITGIYLIQLAYHLGYRVICAASPSNHEYVRSLGAEVVLDRWIRSQDLVDQVRAATDDNVVIAIDNVGETTASLCYSILAGSKKWRSTKAGAGTFSNCDINDQSTSRLVPLAGYPRVRPSDDDAVRDVGDLRVSFSTTFYAHRAFSEQLLDRYTALLVAGQVKPARTQLVEGGLHGIQKGLDDLRHGKVPGGYKLVARLADTE